MSVLMVHPTSPKQQRHYKWCGYITTSFVNTNQLVNGVGFITGSDDITGNDGHHFLNLRPQEPLGVSFDGTSNISLNNNAITSSAGYITTSFTRTSQLTNDGYHHINHITSDLNNDVGFITSIVTGDFSVSGNISIGGTLTYEDVTNVDSVGLVTQDGIKVPDSQKINVGTSDDLQIYHDGSHSYIDDGYW